MIPISRPRWSLGHARGKPPHATDEPVTTPRDSESEPTATETVHPSHSVDHEHADLQAALKLQQLLKQVHSSVATATEGLGVSQVLMLSELPTSGMKRLELADRMGISKQACGQLVRQLLASGHVRLRATTMTNLVVRTQHGDRAADAYRARMLKLEHEWISRVGVKRYAVFRSVLIELTCTQDER